MVLMAFQSYAQKIPKEVEEDKVIYLGNALEDIKQASQMEGIFKRGTHEFEIVIHMQVRNADQYCNYWQPSFSGSIGPDFINDVKANINQLNAHLSGSSITFNVCDEIIYTIDDTQLDPDDVTTEATMTAKHQANRFNLYIVDWIDGANGYAYIGPSAERIFIRRSRATTSTLWHELGHSLGLRHTHGNTNGTLTNELVNGSNCSTAADMLCDTPADPQLSSSNVNGSCNYVGGATDANGNTFNPDESNIMSYSPNNCRNSYTQDQKNLAHNLIDNFNWHSTKINSCALDLDGPASAAVCPDYDAKKIIGTTVSGDFDRDGFHDDVAALYDYGGNTCAWHVWTGEQDEFEFQGTGTPFWYGGAFDANKVKFRVVSGDFDQDGFHDDIATFYHYGGNHSKAFVFLSNGSSFSVSNAGWWEGTSFNASRMTGCLVSGDFDHDGFHDDVLGLYDYGNLTSSFFVWRGSTSTFNSGGAVWTSTQYEGQRTATRMVSGDFDQDGFHDDIAAQYDYAGWTAEWHTWQPNGSLTAMQYTGNWFSHSSYDPLKIAGRVVAADLDKDGFVDDITALYDYGGFTCTYHSWRGMGSYFAGTFNSYNFSSYDPTKVTGRIVTGDFDSDGDFNDVTAFYDYGHNGATSRWETRAHMWHSNSISGFTIDNGSRGWWGYCCANNGNQLKREEVRTENVSQDNETGIVIYPNPADQYVIIQNLNADEKTIIRLFDSTGRLMMETNASGTNREQLDLAGFKPGLYFVVFDNGVSRQSQRLLIQ